MIFAQKYAELNRLTILKRILNYFPNHKFSETEVVKSIHNYIDFEDLVLRKAINYGID